MNDKLFMSRCNESEVNQHIQTLNDYTLLLTKDTHNLYTKVNGSRVHLATGSTLFSVDQPILKELSVFATNDEGIALTKDKYYGICGNDDSTYRICDSTTYDGELIGILDSTTPVDGKYIIKLIENKNVFTDVASEMVKWKPVYIGNYRGTIIAVVNPNKLDTVFGIGGVVTDVTSNPLVGKFTFNSFLLQATYFAKLHTDDEHINDLINALLVGYYTKQEVDSLIVNLNGSITTLESKVNANSAKLEDVYTKNEVNIKLHDKADTSSIYNRVETDGKLERKADKLNTYTKTEVDNLVGTGVLPTPPQTEDIFGIIKDKSYRAITADYLVSQEAQPQQTSLLSMKDGKIYKSSRWDLGETNLTNTDATITLSGGSEGDLIVGSLWGNNGNGIGVAKNSNLNTIEFKDGKLIHKHGSYDNPDSEVILSRKDAYTKDETYTKDEVDNKVNQGGGTGSGLKSFEVDPTDKYKLIITDTADNKYNVNIYDSFIDFNSNGGIHAERQESYNTDVYYWKHPMGLNVEMPIPLRHFTTKRAKGCLSILAEGDIDVIKVAKPYQTIKFGGYISAFYGISYDDCNNDQRKGYFRRVVKAYVRRDPSDSWRLLNEKPYTWTDPHVMMTNERTNFVPDSLFNTPDYPCEIRFTLTYTHYGDNPSASFVRDWKWGISVFPSVEYRTYGFTFEAKNAIPSNWTEFTVDSNLVTVESILDMVKAEHYTKQESIDLVDAKITTKADKSELEDKVDRTELSEYANKDDLYLKADRTELSLKADKTSVYDKSEVHRKEDVYHISETYNKLEVDSLIANNSGGSGGGNPTLPQETGLFAMDKLCNYKKITPSNLGMTSVTTNSLVTTGSTSNSPFSTAGWSISSGSLLTTYTGSYVEAKGNDNKYIRMGTMLDGLGNGIGSEWGSHISALLVRRDGLYTHNGTDSAKAKKLATVDDLLALETKINLLLNK